MTQIQKLVHRGNSYYLKVSPAMLRLLGIGESDNLNVTVESGRITVQPVETIPKISQADQEFVDRTYAKYEPAFKAWTE